MPEESTSPFGVNSWLQDELYQQYLHDKRAVDDSWRQIFEGNGNGSNGASVAPSGPPAGAGALAPTRSNGNGSASTALIPAPPAHQAVSGEQLVPLRGAAARIAENMTASLSIPVATSQRSIAVKVIDENRRLLNEYRTAAGAGKISYTHIVGWAIVKAVASNPSLNNAYAQMDGEGFRAVRNQINLGLAVDVAGKDGARSLKVPNIKNAGALTFDAYLAAFDDIVARARNNKLQLSDFEGTTISLTNPGTVGTVGSVPRLMPGQGAIIATGAIDYPPEFRGANEEMVAALALSKVMMVTCTYDHRVIQGAESGLFLGALQNLLQGEDGFYEGIFGALNIPYQPLHWQKDRPALSPAAAPMDAEGAAKQASVSQLIHMFRVRGHLMADIDPLGFSERGTHPELDPANYGLSLWDLDRRFLTGTLKGHVYSSQEPAALREILDTVRETYCGKIGCEYMHIQYPEQRQWLQERMETTRNLWPLSPETRMRALRRLLEAEEFEHFLGKRFLGHKRFSLEGAESAMVIMDELLERAAATSVHEVVIGMAHRGRLNILANIVGKSMVQVFSEFEGSDPQSTQGSGDVKYHLGASGVRKTEGGKDIIVSVAFNPSHLEAVDPVVEGIVRPKQDWLGDTERERVIPLLIHGDAAFAGQGVVAETLNLSQLQGYKTGGTVHLVINNQIGFTTNPIESRSATYSTDIARMVQAPIFHVNGDDPEACVRVSQLAYDFRQQFKKDVVIDMVCYRRHGHNEADDPSYTQPLLYRKIAKHPSVAVQYSGRVTEEGLVDAARVAEMRKAVYSGLNDIYDQSKKKSEQFETQELSAVDPGAIDRVKPHTAIDRATLERIVTGLTSFPAGFTVHPKLKGFLEKRKEIVNGTPIDWALGEALAFGSLVLEDTPVRLSGQDSSRGTFSQRHLEYYDYETGQPYIPLQHLSPDQARFDVYDSSLSEYAVMGFEFGYSVADPVTLVIWEAQFGDFANGAQIMIDQFISAAETKWSQPSGLVLLLPHGYEGQGPEHSSARLERFLQLCAENNMQVCNCTTPAQYFHLLRRQMFGGPDRRGVRKPLILFTPKRMLRHPRAVSGFGDLISGGFHEALPDTVDLDASRVNRVLFCTGQLYFDLLTAREERKIDTVALLRLEQMYPFPAQEIEALLAHYPAGAEVAWVQEEPRNMGAWPFVQSCFAGVLEATGRAPRYIGRPEGASPSAGSLKRHQQEQAEVIDTALSLDLSKKAKPAKRKAK